MMPPSLPNDVLATTDSAGQSVDEGRGRIFPCGQCGADLEFHIGAQSLKCRHCGAVQEIELPEDAALVEQNFHGMLARLRQWREEQADDAQSDQQEIRCESCGGHVVFVGALTSSECPYCGSPIQRDEAHVAQRRIPVDGVLPFLVTRQSAQENLAAWVKSRWFAPNDFYKRGAAGRFSGVYLPFWTFDSLTFTRYQGQRGEHYYVTVGSGKNKRRVRRTRWYPASGSFQRFFDDVLVLAARGLRHDMMIELEPWPLGKCVPFNQKMLAGHLARTYEVELEEGFTAGKQRIDAAIERNVRQRIGGDAQHVHSIHTNYGALTFKHLLLPTWLLSYRYKEKVYQVMINATTGEVQGERPYSWIKITLAVLAGVAAGAAGWFFFSQ